MKRIVVFLLLVSTTSFAQKADYVSADEFSEWNLRKVVGSTSVMPNESQVHPDFWYSYTTTKGVDYYYADPKRKLHEKIFDETSLIDMIRKQLGVSLERAKPESIVPSEDGKYLKITIDTLYFQMNMKSKVLTFIKRPKRVPRSSNGWVGPVSSDGRFAAYVEEHNVYLKDLQTNTTTQMTFDGEKMYSFEGTEDGIADPTMKPNIVWFADSHKFYITRSDFRKVSVLEVHNSLEPFEKPEEYVIYPPGSKYVPQHEVNIFDADSKTGLKVAIDKWKDQTLKVVKDGEGNYCERLYLIRKKRTCDELELCKVNPEDGSVKILFNEVCKPYFNTEVHHISVLNQGNDIVWHSERSGFGHYYHYDGEGNLKNAITEGDWFAGNMVYVDEKRREIYFYGYGQVANENPYYARLNKASIDGKYKSVCLTPEKGTHDVYFLGKDKKYFVDNYSRADLVPVSVVRDIKGKIILNLASPDLSKLYEMGWQLPEEIHMKAADNETDLYGFMWKPFKMEEGRKYPIISHAYPGPSSEGMLLSFNPAHINSSLAQVGFVVVNFGHRGGSSYRDLKYRTYGYGNLRDFALEDDKYGLEQLAEQYSFVDISKVGIYGHSAGGFMAMTSICTYPEFYKAAVSTAGNHDRSATNLWWGESFHGVNEVHKQVNRKVKNPITGKDSTYVEDVISFESDIPSNLELAKKLEGHLLLITGDADLAVNYSNTMRMTNALVKAGKKFDVWVYPRQRHAFVSYYRDLYVRQVWFHFGKYLLDDFSSEKFVNMKDYLKEKP